MSIGKQIGMYPLLQFSGLCICLCRRKRTVIVQKNRLLFAVNDFADGFVRQGVFVCQLVNGDAGANLILDLKIPFGNISFIAGSFAPGLAFADGWDIDG